MLCINRVEKLVKINLTELTDGNVCPGMLLCMMATLTVEQRYLALPEALHSVKEALPRQ